MPLHLYVACLLLVHFFRMPMMTWSKIFIWIVSESIFGNFCTLKMHANTFHILENGSTCIYQGTLVIYIFTHQRGFKSFKKRFSVMVLHTINFEHNFGKIIVYFSASFILRVKKKLEKADLVIIWLWAFLYSASRIANSEKDFFCVECLKITPVRLVILVTGTITVLCERCAGFLRGTK